MRRSGAPRKLELMSEPVIETRGLSKAYGAVKALDDFSLTIPRGGVYAFWGRTGRASPPCSASCSA